MTVPGSGRAKEWLISTFSLSGEDLAFVRSAWRAAKGATGVLLTDLITGAGTIISDWRTLLATYLVPMLGFGAVKRHRVQVENALRTVPPEQQ